MPTPPAQTTTRKRDDDDERFPEIAVREPGGSSPALVRTSKNLAQLESSVSHYPEPIRAEVRWIHGFFLEHCQANFESLRAAACKLGHDRSREYFRNLLVGDYFTSKSTRWKPGGAAWAGFLELANALRKYAQMIERSGKLPFVQTPTYRCIANFITQKRALDAVCKIGGIVAPTGGQTSESFKFYRTLNNHGAVTHLEAPANGRQNALETKIAEQYHVGGWRLLRGSNPRQQVIRENVNETRCIIIDNAQVLYVRGAGNDQPCFNFLRELYDDRNPTIILKFTEDFFQDTLSNSAALVYFEQFLGRMGGLNALLRLPKYAPAADLRTIAKAFGLSPRDEQTMKLFTDWSRQPGRIRILFDRLQLAKTFARADGRTDLTVDDLVEARDYVPPAIGSEDDEEGGA